MSSDIICIWQIHDSTRCGCQSYLSSSKKQIAKLRINTNYFFTLPRIFSFVLVNGSVVLIKLDGIIHSLIKEIEVLQII